MASIVILEHRFQDRLKRRYLAHLWAERWRRQGHRVVVQRGPDDPPAADLALLNLDLTVVPEPYRRLAARYERVLNGAVLDVSKRRISRQLLAGPDDPWDGPVLVKTDANYGGLPEMMLRHQAEQAGRRSAIPPVVALEGYSLFPNPRAVPPAVWTTPSLVVERFLPEREGEAYCMRVWTFLGTRERSTRYRAAVPVIKSSDVRGAEPVPVPDEIREARRALGFDYGKLDYVRHDGRWVLLDANRTPGAPDNLLADPALAASLEGLADGLADYLG
ncbi:MAG: hypothetical protein U1E53_30500 [Dongiaceae bacterium]